LIPSTPALDRFFRVAAEPFAETARDGVARLERDYDIAGSIVAMRFAGPTLVSTLCPAIDHLAADAGSTPALTALVGDGRTSGVPRPSPPWNLLRYVERGNVRAYADERFVLVYDWRTDVFTALDLERPIALYWTGDAERLPYYELAAPMRHLFQAWLQSRGLFITHAGAVGHADAGALLAGRTGSGKSMTAVTCLLADLGYLSDDYVLVSADPPRIYSLYSSAKINARELPRFPELRASVRNPARLDVEKALIALDPTFAKQLVRQAELRVTLLLHVSGLTDTGVSRVSPSEAFKAMAPDTVFTLLGNPRVTLRGLHRLVEEIPCYRLELGTDRSRIPDVISSVMARHA
jgi:hypothetical protein